MRRVLVVILLALSLLLAVYFFNSYWTHRFDPLIRRQAAIYRVDPDLVWSIIYEETYFSPWKMGKDGEIGLMRVTRSQARSSLIASTSLRRVLTCSRSCNVTGSLRTQRTRALRFRRLHPPDDDYLFGALGRSRIGCTDREWCCRG